MLLGWYIDIIIGYLFRTLMRFFKITRSGTWPIERATISSVDGPRLVYGGPYAELGYTYTHNGQYYAGVHRKPFMLRGSAEEYAARRRVGDEIPIRINPIRPENSIVAVDD